MQVAGQEGWVPRGGAALLFVRLEVEGGEWGVRVQFAKFGERVRHHVYTL